MSIPIFPQSLLTILRSSCLTLAIVGLSLNASITQAENDESYTPSYSSAYGDTSYDTTGTEKKQRFGKRKGKPSWDKLANKLGIDDSRKAAFIEAMQAQHQQRVEIRQNSGIREAMEGVDSELQQTMANLLSEDELAAFTAHQEKRKARREKRMEKRQPE